MPIKSLTNEQYINQLLKKTIDNVSFVLFRRLSKIGEESVAIARNLGSEYKSMSAKKREELRHRKHTPNYIDDTGNLRASIGYLVAIDGQVMISDFKKNESQQLAENVLKQHTLGVALIMTAGMEYAYTVSKKGYDILDSAEYNARKKMGDFIQKLKNKI